MGDIEYKRLKYGYKLKKLRAQTKENLIGGKIIPSSATSSAATNASTSAAITPCLFDYNRTIDSDQCEIRYPISTPNQQSIPLSIVVQFYKAKFVSDITTGQLENQLFIDIQENSGPGRGKRVYYVGGPLPTTGQLSEEFLSEQYKTKTLIATSTSPLVLNDTAKSIIKFAIDYILDDLSTRAGFSTIVTPMRSLIQTQSWYPSVISTPTNCSVHTTIQAQIGGFVNPQKSIPSSTIPMISAPTGPSPPIFNYRRNNRNVCILSYSSLEFIITVIFYPSSVAVSQNRFEIEVVGNDGRSNTLYSVTGPSQSTGEYQFNTFQTNIVLNDSIKNLLKFAIDYLLNDLSTRGFSQIVAYIQPLIETQLWYSSATSTHCLVRTTIQA